VATAAVIAGFGAAVLVYGPIGQPYRQLSGSTLGSPPVGVSFGTGGELMATGIPLVNASGFTNWTWNMGINNTGPCNTSGVLTAGVYNATYGNVTVGNDTLVCLNAVMPGGSLNSTWYAGLSTPSYLTDLQGATGIPSGQNFSANGQTVSSCNSFTDGSWNATHIDNASFTPCNTFYQMNNNTAIEPSFDGMANSTAWVLNTTANGFESTDVVYMIPVVFSNLSTNGLYEISVAIAGVTPVPQTFLFNNMVQGGASSGTVVIVFDMTAAWLFDATYGFNGTGAAPANSTMPEIYGAIGLASVVITQCTIDGVCPVQT
jgi:hypothetical protein